MKNALDAYRLPPEVVDGTWIEVPGTSVKARCTLPSVHNEDFQIALIAQLGSDVSVDHDKKELSGHTAKIKPAMRAAFVEACIKEVEGLPDGVTNEELVLKFRLAVDSLMAQAQVLGAAMDEKVLAALKNLKTFSNGRADGKEGSKSTKSAKPGATSKTKTVAQV